MVVATPAFSEEGRMARTRSSGLTFGVLLVAVGAVLLATRYVRIGSAPLWLLGLGIAFSLIAILGRSYASLVAGMILLGVGAGMVLESRGVGGMPRSSWIPLCLAVGFLGIWLLGLVLQLQKHWWPLIPAVALAIYGGAGLIGRLPVKLAAMVLDWWPLALVLVGAVLVFRALRR
jgi:hypothetical protein